MKQTIIIMAKVPLAGTVKTRLQAILPPEKCAALAAAFLHDTLKKAETVGENIILAYSPAGQTTVLKSFISPETVLLEQRGANLGEKMANAFEFAFDEAAAVVMVGTDSPTFPARYLSQAFSLLAQRAEIVLGKSRDGGFYLIGLRKPLPHIFENIAWSSPQVFAQITDNIKRAGIENLEFVPEHYDVDAPEDLLTLKNELFADETARKSAQNTYQWLLANG